MVFSLNKQVDTLTAKNVIAENFTSPALEQRLDDIENSLAGAAGLGTSGNPIPDIYVAGLHAGHIYSTSGNGPVTLHANMVPAGDATVSLGTAQDPLQDVHATSVETANLTLNGSELGVVGGQLYLEGVPIVSDAGQLDALDTRVDALEAAGVVTTSTLNSHNTRIGTQEVPAVDMYTQDIHTDNIKALTGASLLLNNTILPSANGTLDIGSTSARLANVYSESTNTNSLHADAIELEGDSMPLLSTWNSGVSMGNETGIIHRILYISEWSLYVGVISYSGTRGAVFTSPDAITWTHRPLVGGVERSFTSIAYSPTLNIAIITGPQAVYYSNNTGVTWLLGYENLAAANTFPGVSAVWMPAPGRFVCVGNVDVVAVSTNATVWSFSVDTYPLMSSVAWSAPLGLFVASVAGSIAHVYTSPNGAIWTQRALPETVSVDPISPGMVVWAAGLSLFYLPIESGDGGTAFISSNGIDWRRTTFLPRVRASHWEPTLGVLFLASSSGDGLVYYSFNAETWYVTSTGYSASIHTFAYNSATGRAVIGGNSGNFIRYSTTSAGGAPLYQVAANGRDVVLGTDTASGMVFNTNGTVRLSVNSTGTVSVPGDLVVAGSASFVDVPSSGMVRLDSNKRMRTTDDIEINDSGDILNVKTARLEVDGDTIVTGMIGVKTANPAYAVDIVGGLRASSHVSFGNTLTVDQGCSVRTLAVTEFMTVDEITAGGDCWFYGNVGISTGLPTEKLDVNGNAIVRGSLTATGSINNSGSINGGGSINCPGSVNAGGSINTPLSVFAGGSVNADGDINGLNMSLTGNATVNGQVLGASDLIRFPGSTPGAINKRQVDGSTNIDRFIRFRNGGGSPSGFAGIQLSHFDDNNYYIFPTSLGLGFFHNTVNSDVKGEYGTRLMTLSPNGNLGIGTDNPVQRLHVAGSGLLTNGLVRQFDNRNLAPDDATASTTTFGFGSYNNNNTAPWADIIHLNNWGDTGGGDPSALMINRSGYGIRQWRGTYGSSDAYSTYHDVVMSDSNGNVGIGTTSPAARLHVSGTSILGGRLDVEGNIVATGHITTTDLFTNRHARYQDVATVVRFNTTTNVFEFLPNHGAQWISSITTTANSTGLSFTLDSSDILVSGANPTSLVCCDETYARYGVQCGISNGGTSSMVVFLYDGQGVNGGFEYNGSSWIKSSPGGTYFDHITSIDTSLFASTGRIRVNHDTVDGPHICNATPVYIAGTPIAYDIKTVSFAGITDFYLTNPTTGAVITTPSSGYRIQFSRAGCVRFTINSFKTATIHGNANFWILVRWGDMQSRMY